MATINFPNNPAVGVAFSAANKTWIWDGVRWVIQSRAAAPAAPTSVTYYAASEADMLLLPATQGDICVRTDLLPNKVFQIKTPFNTAFVDWQAIGFTDQQSAIEYGAVVTDVDPFTDDIYIDVNSNDFTGHAYEDPSAPGNLLIEAHHTVIFGNSSGQTWEWFGPKPVSLGTDVAAPDYHIAIPPEIQLIASSGNTVVTTTVPDTAALILSPYQQGDVRVLEDSDTNTAGAYKATQDSPAVGNIAHWVLMAPDDYGVLV